MEPTEEWKDEIEKAREPFDRKVGGSMAIVAAVLTLVGVYGHISTTEELLAQQKASDQWAFYQAKALRRYQSEVAKDLLTAMNGAATAANWQSRPSPKAGNPSTGVVAGRGIANVLYEGNNGYCALVAEVEVDQDSGSIVVKRFSASGDSGPVSNPDGLRNQEVPLLAQIVGVVDVFDAVTSERPYHAAMSREAVPHGRNQHVFV